MKFKKYFFKLSTLLLFCNLHSNSQSISGIVNSYYKVTNFIPAYNGVRVLNITGLTTNDRVLIIQMKGAVINEANSSSFGTVSSINNAGAYEFATICGFINDTVIFKNQLLNTYDYLQDVQLVKIPVYTNVTVSAPLLAGEWDPLSGTGGILAIEATGTITLNSNISADSAGFKGGVHFVNPASSCGPVSNWFYSLAQSSGSNQGGSPKGEGIAGFIANKEHGRGKQANGGGGGNVDNTGGGGGSNYGAGGNGGNKSNTTFCNATTAGQGGISLSAYGYPASVTPASTNNRIFLGGGGGCGEMNNIYSGSYGADTPGGDGGGIIFIKCNTLVGNGYTISANGAQGVNPVLPVKTEAAGDGGGGGGAGGVVILDIGTYTGTVNAFARGADGSKAGFQNQCPGPGGGGGGGVVWHSGTLPGTVTTNVSGGASGTIKDAPAHNPPCEYLPNGAIAGSAGLVQSGFEVLEGTVFNCGAVLSVQSVTGWRGRQIPAGILLEWKVTQSNSIEEIRLEKQKFRGGFVTLSTSKNPHNSDYNYLDVSNELPAAYRLMILTKSAERTYTHHLFFERKKTNRLVIYPNPVQSEFKIELPVTSGAGKTTASVFDYSGKVVLTREIFLTRNVNTASISVNGIAKGNYTVKCYWNNELYIGKFIKQ